VQLLGTQQLAALVVIAMVSGFHDKPLELLVQSLVRARMCELVARATGLATPDQLFTAGLLSLLDVILDQPLPELLKQLPMTPLIAEALEGRSTPAAQIVAAARAQERCAWDELAATGIAVDVVGAAWRSAVVWTRELLAQL
jgi:c-di-GMP phosphodiesterase